MKRADKYWISSDAASQFVWLPTILTECILYDQQTLWKYYSSKLLDRNCSQSIEIIEIGNDVIIGMGVRVNSSMFGSNRPDHYYISRRMCFIFNWVLIRTMFQFHVLEWLLNIRTWAVSYRKWKTFFDIMLSIRTEFWAKIIIFPINNTWPISHNMSSITITKSINCRLHYSWSCWGHYTKIQYKH